MKPWLLTSFSGVWLTLLVLFSTEAKADSWAMPHDRTYYSENGQYQFFVAVKNFDVPRETRPSGLLSRKSAGQWQGVWTNGLANQISPVQVMVHNSGRYVVTFDEYHSVGENPVVIYGDKGRLIANLSLADLKLENHPNISRSVSSYWWNEYAIMVFGPPATTASEPWQRTLQDSLFIRLFWGEVIAIDLASGKVRNADWWQGMEPEHATDMKAATEAYLDATWRRLAGEYMRKDNFAPDAKGVGVRGVLGILLVGQLRLREALPLLREIAATERFRHLAAPRWKTGQDGNVSALARAVIAEIE